MNFNRSLIFSYLEEDNMQRAYFRVRPLLTLDGDVREESLTLWPNEGGLRIVPDRNEQHTFKTRMRTLGAYCVVDLRGQPTEAGKIRTNKNFRPERGEVNQYILYSDTVHELPEHTFYQLLDGKAEDHATLSEQAITPLYYIRQDNTLYGPVKKNATDVPSPAAEAAGVLFELPCPDGITRNMLCFDDCPDQVIIDEEAAPVAEPQQALPEGQEPTPTETAAEVVEVPVQQEALPIGETLHILDKDQKHEDTLQQLNKPVSDNANLLRRKEAPTESIPAADRKNEQLSGTPLIRTPLHMSVQQTKNRTQEIVSNQWSVGKYEAPAQNLPAGAKLQAVSNPVEAACTNLRQAWNASSAHEQLIDCILSLDGIHGQLETKLCAGKTGTIMQRVLQQRLQDLEAERLSALCELDKAKRDVDAYKQELLTAMASRVNKEISSLETNKQTLQTQVDGLKEEANALVLQRDALLTKINELQKENMPEVVAKLLADFQMAAPTADVPLRLSPVSGENLDLAQLIDRLMQACQASGIAIDHNYAIALLVLLAISPRIGISCPTTAAASTLLKNIAVGMGWQGSYAHQYAAEQRPVVGIRPVDSTPAVLTTSLPNYAPIVGMTKLTLSRNTSSLIRNAAYDTAQWPILLLPALTSIPELDETLPPISAASIAALAEKASVSKAELDSILAPIVKAAIPLSGSAQKDMYRFVSICAGLMEGGLPVAADWAILLWIVPALEHGSKYYHAVKPLLDEYPRSLAKL